MEELEPNWVWCWSLSSQGVNIHQESLLPPQVVTCGFSLKVALTLIPFDPAPVESNSFHSFNLKRKKSDIVQECLCMWVLGHLECSKFSSDPSLRWSWEQADRKRRWKCDILMTAPILLMGHWPSSSLKMPALSIAPNWDFILILHLLIKF